MKGLVSCKEVLGVWDVFVSTVVYCSYLFLYHESCCIDSYVMFCVHTHLYLWSCPNKWKSCPDEIDGFRVVWCWGFSKSLENVSPQEFLRCLMDLWFRIIVLPAFVLLVPKQIGKTCRFPCCFPNIFLADHANMVFPRVSWLQPSPGRRCLRWGALSLREMRQQLIERGPLSEEDRNCYFMLFLFKKTTKKRPHFTKCIYIYINLFN